jgi:hypothetical protein
LTTKVSIINFSFATALKPSVMRTAFGPAAAILGIAELA